MKQYLLLQLDQIFCDWPIWKAAPMLTLIFALGALALVGVVEIGNFLLHVLAQHMANTIAHEMR